MNNARRKKLNALYDQLADIKETLDVIRDEEDEYAENMPENLQCGERYQKATDAVDNMYCAISSIEEALDYITEASY